MATTDEVIQRLQESRPPATDTFTYLTIIEKSLSPEILPALQDILDDAELTGDIGWDLVEMLVKTPGADGCLDRIARLGNPREVILKALEVMESTRAAAGGGGGGPGGDETAEGADSPAGDEVFIKLVGMLTVLHARLKVKAPSRFVWTTLDTLLRCYDATSAAQTDAIIAFVRSSSGQTRPPLPARKSSTFQNQDLTLGSTATASGGKTAGSAAPDPEAEESDRASEKDLELTRSMLLSFVTHVFAAYANANSVEWASRLYEYTTPERIVPGRPTMMRAFRDIDDFQSRDTLVGQLVALANDLGLSRLSPHEVDLALQGNPADRTWPAEPTDGATVGLSTRGFICICAYRMFASEVFDANHVLYPQSIFPAHHDLLRRWLEDREDVQPQEAIATDPGTFEALAVMAHYLQARNQITCTADGDQLEDEAEFMQYMHVVTLISLFHPNVRVRNVATVTAGEMLHAVPDETDRLEILRDLLEHCSFATLRACAVTWLWEEIRKANKDSSAGGKAENGTEASIFGTTRCISELHEIVFPDLRHLAGENSTSELLEFWAEEGAFQLQVANFAVLLKPGSAYAGLVEDAISRDVVDRYVVPLRQMAERLEKEGATPAAPGEAQGEGEAAKGVEPEVVGEMVILLDALKRGAATWATS